MINKSIATAVAASLLCAPVPALAAPVDVIQPVQVGNERLRFDRGEFMLDADGRTASVQVTPLADDHGNLSFSVAILNASNAPINVDTTNIRVEGTAEPVRVLTRREVEAKAKSRSILAAVLVGMAGGIAAGIAAGQRNNYRVTTRTPRGTYRTNISAPCSACQVNSALIAAGTGAAIARVNDRLDQTRRELGNDMLQLTTIDPGESYAGRIYLTRFKRATLSQMRLIVTVNGEDFPFGFRFAQRGMAVPEFKSTLAAAEPAPVATPALQPAVVVAPIAEAPRAPVIAIATPEAPVAVAAVAKPIPVALPAPVLAKPAEAPAARVAAPAATATYGAMVAAAAPVRVITHPAPVVARARSGYTPLPSYASGPMVKIQAAQQAAPIE